MIYIFHGDNQSQSRQALNESLNKNKDYDILRLDHKEVDPDTINNFINSQSLFLNKRIVVFSNLFSVPKPILDKLIKIIKSNNDIDIYIWQDKALTVTQIKTFQNPIIKSFSLDKIIFQCLNNIRPGNLQRFIPLYKQVIQEQPFELFHFLVKLNLRKQLTTFTSFNPKLLKKAYLQTIELDYQNKTGQLTIPKEIALERVFLNLMK